MPDRDDEGWGEGRAGSRRREGPLSSFLTSAARALEAESDRWFLWLPVLFAGGIIAYFALADEPGARVAAALLLGATGLCLAARHAALGLFIGGAALAFAAGFTAAKLRTEAVRAPVLAQELRYVKVAGFVGLFANLVAAPLVSLLIMPMALLSLIAMPFGLEAWPLKAMGLGIELMVATGRWVASWPGAVSVLPRISGSALILIVLGGIWLCLWRTRIRALGLAIAAAGLALAPQAERPDILVEREGSTAALRSSSGSLFFPPATASSYSVDNWPLADGDDRDVTAASEEGAFRCDSLGCIGVVKGKTVALVRHPGALEEDCRRADIVIAPFTLGKKCRAARVIVDRRALKTHGAHALYVEGLSIRTETVAAARGTRPWTPDRAKPHQPLREKSQ